MLNDAERYLLKDTEVFLDRIPNLQTRNGLSSRCKVFSVQPGFIVLYIMLAQAPEVPGYVINVNTSDVDWNESEKRWELPFDRVRIPK